MYKAMENIARIIHMCMLCDLVPCAVETHSNILAATIALSLLPSP